MHPSDHSMILAAVRYLKDIYTEWEKQYAVATKTVSQYSTLATTDCLLLEMQLLVVDKL